MPPSRRKVGRSALCARKCCGRIWSCCPAHTPCATDAARSWWNAPRASPAPRQAAQFLMCRLNALFCSIEARPATSGLPEGRCLGTSVLHRTCRSVEARCCMFSTLMHFLRFTGPFNTCLILICSGLHPENWLDQPSQGLVRHALEMVRCATSRMFCRRSCGKHMDQTYFIRSKLQLPAIQSQIA